MSFTAYRIWLLFRFLRKLKLSSTIKLLLTHICSLHVIKLYTLVHSRDVISADVKVNLCPGQRLSLSSLLKSVCKKTYTIRFWFSLKICAWLLIFALRKVMFLCCENSLLFFLLIVFRKVRNYFKHFFDFEALAVNNAFKWHFKRSNVMLR